ncbi:MAG TPA: AAA family ATPase, partial [Candidatus Hodarchaeales archaeon]|nr:AAA family ATPase [Candidatus Hodarchaeales archaeon]
KVTPTTGEIGPNTRIELELLKEEKDEPLKVQAPVQFSEIIGQEEAKNKCTIIRKFLSDPELMTSPWAPRNIIFHGAPGTGKTMMARALASALNVKLLSIKAGELIGVYVGEGSKKVQNLFIQAKKSAPCIVFIDELDAIALKRNYQSVRGDVVEIVSSLLGELDGFYENRGIVTIAATNLVSEIDHAILSRFEEIIEFKLPTQEERRQILAHKSSTSPIPFEADWNRLAAETKSWSGRDLVDKLLKTAIHQAILGDKKKIANDDLLKIIKSNTSEQSQKHYV